jgi:V-type H+-transporting ATPase subunit H
MTFPVVLIPSPVHEAFGSIQWDSFLHLKLSNPEKALLQAGEQNVIEYTLYDKEDAAAYVQLLLKVLDQITSHRGTSSRRTSLKVSKLSLAESLPPVDALQYLDCDGIGVATHYVISQLYEVITTLKSNAFASRTKSNSVVASSNFVSKATLSSIFYPSGILIDDWRPLLRILLGTKSDSYVHRGSGFCLACILLEGCTLQTNGHLFSPISSILESFVSWIVSRLQCSSTRSLSMVTSSLTVIILSKEVRHLFGKAGGVGYLSRRLRVHQKSIDSKISASVQHQYELSYCLWIMSYDCDTSVSMRSHFHRDGSVQALVDMVAAAPREKVVRCALATLRNLATCAADEAPLELAKKNINGSTYLIDMIGCGLPKLIDLMMNCPIADFEISEDLDILHKLLHETCQELTRWDVYKVELDSTNLTWGIVHTEKFFRENARKMEGSDGKFEMVKTLIQLTASDSEDVAAIACFDLGEFVRHYPNGRDIARRLGARDFVFPLIEHKNPKLQRQALTCISKLLVQNWKALG